MKKIIVFSFILFFTIVFVMISYSSKIVNPFIGLKGLVQISLGEETVEKISDEQLRYISKSNEEFISYMELNGYVVEQIGRGIQVERGSERKVLVSEGFIGMYEIFSEQKSNAEG